MDQGLLWESFFACLNASVHCGHPVSSLLLYVEAWDMDNCPRVSEGRLDLAVTGLDVDYEKVDSELDAIRWLIWILATVVNFEEGVGRT